MLHLAKKQAEKSTFKYRVGAVIVSSGRIISQSYNQIRYSKVPIRGKKFPESLHAEQAAIIRALHENHGDTRVFRHSILYVARIRRDGSFGCAKPCSICQCFIKAVGIKHVIHT